MFGLINRAIQRFVIDSYGETKWADVVSVAGLDFREFESMLPYDDALTDAVLRAACLVLDKDHETLLEDLGTYLVTHPNMEVVRRLLRYGGRGFEDFLLSFDELNNRIKLAIPDLEMPEISLQEHGDGNYCLFAVSDREGYGAVLQGILKAVADDYGALILTDLNSGTAQGRVTEHLKVELLEAAFAEGRDFNLGGGMRM
ncbi:MAG: heme NO-binding domain-containing protein [Pseudomonadota bacterium]